MSLRDFLNLITVNEIVTLEKVVALPQSGNVLGARFSEGKNELGESRGINLSHAYSNCVEVKDPFYSLARVFPLQTVSGGLRATESRPLVIGNYKNDEWIDIVDFGVFVVQYGTNYGTGNTPHPTIIHPLADGNGDGIVFTEDFTYVQANALKVKERACFEPAHLTGEAGPRTQLRTRELEKYLPKGMKLIEAGKVGNLGKGK